MATKPVDFRKGLDGLSALVQSVLRKDPFTGTVFVFRSKRADRLKLLYWVGTGLVTAYPLEKEPQLVRRLVRACNMRLAGIVLSITATTSSGRRSIARC